MWAKIIGLSAVVLLGAAISVSGFLYTPTIPDMTVVHVPKVLGVGVKPEVVQEVKPESKPEPKTIKAVEVKSEPATLVPSVDQQRLAQLEAERKAAETILAQAEAQRAEQKAEAERAAALKAEQLQREIEEKQRQLAIVNTECMNPINSMKQQIVDLKSKFYADVEAISTAGIDRAVYNAQYNHLVEVTNLAIEKLQNQIAGKSLECTTKYGSFFTN